ncbi:hypothetical protein GCM10018952_21220 [Streptosporangium vulgare]
MQEGLPGRRVDPVDGLQSVGLLESPHGHPQRGVVRGAEISGGETQIFKSFLRIVDLDSRAACFEGRELVRQRGVPGIGGGVGHGVRDAEGEGCDQGEDGAGDEGELNGASHM